MIAALAIVLSGCSSGKPRPQTRDALAERLFQTIKDGKILYGHQDDLAYGHNWLVEDWEADTLGRSDVRAVCGRFPAVVGFDLGGIELGADENLDGVPFGLIRKAALTHIGRGGIVTFSWHARNPLTGGDSWDISSDKAVASVLEDGENHEKFMMWLDMAANFIASLRDSDGNPVPVIFRPWHENVGSWFWWGGNLCTPEQYKRLFGMTVTYFREVKGLDNVLFCYSPNGNCTREEYVGRYPGDMFVDILGVDTYESVGSSSLEEAAGRYNAELTAALQMLSALSEEHGKLIALSETGLEGLVDPHWWTEVLYPAIRDYSICYVLTWRNAHDRPTHFYGPWEGYEGADDFRTFASMDQIQLL